WSGDWSLVEVSKGGGETEVPTATGSKTAVEHIKTAVEHINSGTALTHGGESPVENTKTTTATTATTATTTTVPPTSEERKLSSATSAVVTKSPSTAPTSFVASQGNHEHSSKVPTVPGTSSSATGTSSSATGTPSSATGTPSSATGTSSSTTGTSSSVPGTSSSVPGISSSVPGTSSSSSGPVATFTVMGPGSFSTHLAPNTPQVSSTSSPALTHRDDGVLPAAVGQIQCGHPENQTERMLILNFTKTSPCETNFSDDKLVTLLCRAAKATFNPPQDRCHIRLTPIPETQAVAIKEIAIQTNLLPRDVYELLKDKWDELQEVGVSNMKLGDQGPPEETEDRFSMPLIITIVCMASFLLLVAALYGCCHQRLSQRKDQQRLTEELQTVENGYHDNPTLEVMETSSEMQEKKVVNLNGELGDSWIVPLDNLTKDDLDEEEDTHL
ncbi:podocalyxin-like, partial [Lynx pardinus]